MDYNAGKLHKLLTGKNPPIVVDVRSRREYKSAHIPGATHLSFWMMPFRYSILDDYRDRDLVVYCEHGPRAVFARQVLQSKGFAKVACLEGHMQGWRRCGYSLQQK